MIVLSHFAALRVKILHSAINHLFERLYYMKIATPSTDSKVGPDFFEQFWQESWTYIRTVVDVVREPVVILDKNFNVRSANEAFYNFFQIEHGDVEEKSIFELSGGCWDIPSLHKLLEEILPQNTFFKGFEVACDFPSIGRKIMMLNARHIHFKEETTSELFPPIIMLAIEDVTAMMAVADLLTKHTNDANTKLSERTSKLEAQIDALEKKMSKASAK